MGLVDLERVKREELAKEGKCLGRKEGSGGGSSCGKSLGHANADNGCLGLEAAVEDGAKLAEERETGLLCLDRLGSELLQDLLQETRGLGAKKRIGPEEIDEESTVRS